MSTEEQRSKRRAYYAANKAIILARENPKKRQRWAKNKDEINAQRNAKRASNPEPYRERERSYKQAHAIESNEERRKRRAELRDFRQAVKLRYGCMNPACPWNAAYLPEMLEFHHLDPSEKESMVCKCDSMAKQINEINKCTVLCANCHRYAELLTDLPKCHLDDNGQVV